MNSPPWFAIPGLLAAGALVSPSKPIARALAALFTIDVFRQAIAPSIEAPIALHLDPSPHLLRMDVVLFVGWAAVLTHLAVRVLTRRPVVALVCGGSLVAYSLALAASYPTLRDATLISAQGWSRTAELVIVGWAFFASRAQRGWLSFEEGIVLLLIAEQFASRIFGAWVFGDPAGDWHIANVLTVGILSVVLVSLALWRLKWQKKDSG